MYESASAEKSEQSIGRERERGTRSSLQAARPPTKLGGRDMRRRNGTIGYLCFAKYSSDHGYIKVLLRRCDLPSHGGATLAGRGVPAVSHEAVALAAPCTTDHIQEYSEVALVIIKTEPGDEGAVSSKGPVFGEGPVTDVGLFVKEENNWIVKTEVGVGEVSVKQEPDIGPTVLQPQSVPSLPLLLPRVRPAVHPGTSTAPRIMNWPINLSRDIVAKRDMLYEGRLISPRPKVLSDDSLFHNYYH
ncbi:hypothetical protein EVAR_83204_1 [Eumeta japonica]|uniref:Uncharacterized protein n=1 Tax=Eumeta variegata TaxID=151549 RepID=A0A4C1YNX1_EUMVA|nr:hypothetical protein EVAR_83204_1 [Eumeta japonica]